MQVSESYIKQSYSLAWKFFSKNKMASFIVMGVSFVLALFTMIPLLGFFVAVAMGMMFFSVQTYVAKAIMHSENEDEYEQIIVNTTPSELIKQYFPIGAGAYLGFFLIEVIAIIAVIVMLVVSVGIDNITALSNGTMTAQEQMQMYQNLGGIGLVLAIGMMFFAYIYPLVLGRVYRSEDFGEAFQSIFLLFSPSLWKASFNVRYFLLITMLHVTLIGAIVLMTASIMTLVLIPLAAFIAYMLVLYGTSIAVLGNQVSFNDEPSEE